MVPDEKGAGGGRHGPEPQEAPAHPSAERGASWPGSGRLTEDTGIASWEAGAAILCKTKYRKEGATQKIRSVAESCP